MLLAGFDFILLLSWAPCESRFIPALSCAAHRFRFIPPISFAARRFRFIPPLSCAARWFRVIPRFSVSWAFTYPCQMTQPCGSAPVDSPPPPQRVAICVCVCVAPHRVPPCPASAVQIGCPLHQGPFWDSFESCLLLKKAHLLFCPFKWVSLLLLLHTISLTPPLKNRDDYSCVPLMTKSLPSLFKGLWLTKRKWLPPPIK